MTRLGLQTLLLSTWQVEIIFCVSNRLKRNRLFGVIALDLTGQVVWNDVCPGLRVYYSKFLVYWHLQLTDSASLGRAKVVLDSGQLANGIVANGSFTMCVLKLLHSPLRDVDLTLISDVLNSPDVPAGPHLLSVISHDYSFDFVCNVPTLLSIFHSNLPTAASRHRR